MSRTSGRSRDARRCAFLGVVVLLVAGCVAAKEGRSLASGSVAPAPETSATASVAPAAIQSLEPTATPEPTPRPSPTRRPPNNFELAQICAGTAFPTAAPYAGTVHPLVAVYRSGGSDWYVDQGYTYPVNVKWFREEWPGPLQLVVCVDSGSSKVGSCGLYKRVSDGKVGRVDQYRLYEKVRVVVAATAKTLQSKTFYGTTPKCTSELQLDTSNPPWKLFGKEVPDSTVDDYAVAVSTQKVK